MLYYLTFKWNQAISAAVDIFDTIDAFVIQPGIYPSAVEIALLPCFINVETKRPRLQSFLHTSYVSDQSADNDAEDLRESQ